MVGEESVAQDLTQLGGGCDERRVAPPSVGIEEFPFGFLGEALLRAAVAMDHVRVLVLDLRRDVAVTCVEAQHAERVRREVHLARQVGGQLLGDDLRGFKRTFGRARKDQITHYVALGQALTHFWSVPLAAILQGPIFVRPHQLTEFQMRFSNMPVRVDLLGS